MKLSSKKVALALPLPFMAMNVPSAIAAKKTAPTPQERPNIIYLMFDDLGYGDLGCYGQEKIETPNIDALAQNGIRFTNMYTACPLSAPSRGAIMTGKHMGHAQIRNNANPNFHKIPQTLVDVYSENAIFLSPEYEGQVDLKPDTYILPRMMKDNGYKTAMVGKWGLGAPNTNSLPNKMGFDYFYGFLCQALAHSYYPFYLWENDKLVYTGNKLLIPGEKLADGLDPMDIKNYSQFIDKHYSPDLMFDKIQKFVNENAKDPFFLMWTTTVPHSAVQAPLDEVMHYVNKLGDEKPCTEPGLYYPNRYPLATYAAMVTHIDTQVGILVKQLKELNIYDNTIIIVTSDNGPACNPNSPMEYFNSGGPFRCRKGWGKSSLHEGGVRMPFILSWNNHVKPAVSDHVGCFTDLMSTFADLTGATAPANDGITFAPTVLGQPKKQQKHDYLYWEFPGGKGWLGIRIGKWKGICQKVNEGNNQFALFDLENDPQELNDIAAQHPDITKKRWEIVKKEHTPNNAPYPKFDIQINWPKE